MPKIVKSSSPTKEHKSETLQNSKKISHTVIEIHEDSDNSKSKTLFKMSFWDSPDLSPGVDDLLKAMVLKDNSKSLTISMSHYNNKNMIQIISLNLHEVDNLLSRQDLRDSVFQDSIITVLCLGKCFKLIIKEKFEMDEHIQISDKSIPFTCEEETNCRFRNHTNLKASLCDSLQAAKKGLIKSFRRLDDT
jgi:hypothetical protein